MSKSNICCEPSRPEQHWTNAKLFARTQNGKQKSRTTSSKLRGILLIRGTRAVPTCVTRPVSSTSTEKSPFTRLCDHETPAQKRPASRGQEAPFQRSPPQGFWNA